MPETNPQNPNYYEDVMGLRVFVKTILNYKWLLLSVGVLTALLAFLVSSYIVPAKYEANAYVTLTEPIIRAELETSIQISPTLPETSALVELVMADAIINQVVESLKLANYMEENKLEMEVSLQGKSQLHLQVTTTNPKISAQIANGWAQVVVLRLNDLYGTGSLTIVVLKSEVQKAKDNWNIAQEELEVYLPQSQVDILEVKLFEQKNSLASYLNQIEQNKILISDGEVLQSQLSDLDKDLNLSTGYALSIITIQQRAAGEITGYQFQFQADEIFGQGYLVGDGKNDVERLIGALKTRNEEFIVELTIIEENIGELSVAFESEKYSLELLTQKRDLARNAYTALANQLEEIQITINQNWNMVKVSAEAVEPLVPSSPSVKINTFLAGFTGFLLSVCGVIIFNWWNSPTKKQTE